MNGFVGRTQELCFLNERYTSGKAEMIFLYGRRRIGKTETLAHFASGKETFFHFCTQSDSNIQMKQFSQALLSFDIPQKKYISSFENWESAISALCDIPHKDKLIIILDEFPYLVQQASELPSIIQKVWDTSLKSQNVMLIMCGSSMSYMEKEILSEKNPLFGRATGIMRMKEMFFFGSNGVFP